MHNLWLLIGLGVDVVMEEMLGKPLGSSQLIQSGATVGKGEGG